MPHARAYDQRIVRRRALSTGPDAEPEYLDRLAILAIVTAHPERIQYAGRLEAGPLSAWLAGIRATLRQSWQCRIYFSAGLLVFIAGLLALYTGIRPTGWSTGWPSLYLFEGIAVFSFGVAWFASAWDGGLTAPAGG